MTLLEFHEKVMSLNQLSHSGGFVYPNLKTFQRNKASNIDLLSNTIVQEISFYEKV